LAIICGRGGVAMLGSNQLMISYEKLRFSGVQEEKKDKRY
jgi:hypothetical protein